MRRTIGWLELAWLLYLYMPAFANQALAYCIPRTFQEQLELILLNSIQLLVDCYTMYTNNTGIYI